MRTALLVFGLGFGIVGAAQTWFPPEAVWHYGYYQQPAQNGYVLHTVVGDTVIAGQACKNLSRVRESYDQLQGTYSTFVFDPLFVSESNGLVMVYCTADGAFDTLYWMNAPPGDHWQLPNEPLCWNCDSLSSILVTDTGHVVISGVTVRWSAVEIDWGANVWFNYVDTIYDRIGFSGIYFLPVDVSNGFSDGQSGGPFRCYEDVEIAMERFPTCDLINVGVDEHGALWRDIGLWPNPGTGELNVDPGCANCSYEIKVRDALGRSVVAGRVDQGTAAFDLPELAAGVYRVQLQLDNGTRRAASWIKH